MIAKEGNMTRAAEKLNVSQPSLSQLVEDLEHNLKAKLFERLSRGMRLTAQGERLYAFAEKIVLETEEFEKIFYEKDDAVEGDLKIVTTRYIGTNLLVPYLKDFLKNYPKLRVQILLNDEELHSLNEGDIAICAFIPDQPDLVQEQLYTVNVRLFASQDYLKEYGTPQKPEELNNHRLIIYKDSYYRSYGNWILSVGNNNDDIQRKPYIRIDSVSGMMNCALQGYGIVELPDFKNILNSELQEVLPDIQGPQVPIYFVFHKSRKGSKKILKLFKYLVAKGK